MARNRACITDRLANRYYVSHSHHPKLDDLRGMLWSTGWETGGRVHLVGTIIDRITGAYLTRYPNPRTSNPSRCSSVVASSKQEPSERNDEEVEGLE